MIQILIALLLGVAAGCVTGLTPGVHINLVALLLFTYSSFFLEYTTTLVLVVFIISMAITHTFLDFIPSIFLGAPDDDTALSVLPGHRFLLKGQGYGAVKLTLIGSFSALFIILLMTPVFIFCLPKVYPFIKQYMAFILIAASCFLIFKEKKNRFWALMLFLLSGILGIATLNLAVIKQPLFPLLSGLFGISLLTVSFLRNIKIPLQKITTIKIKPKESMKALGASIIAGPLVSFLPGLGSAQAAVIGSEIAGKLSRKGFLVLLGAINTIVMGLSFVALYVIQKSRTGAAVIVGKLLESFTLNHLLLFLTVALVAGSIATFLTLEFAKLFARGISKLNYRYLCLGIIALVTILTIPLSGIFGLLVLFTGTSIGIVAALKGIRKMHLMGCLLLPVILYFL